MPTAGAADEADKADESANGAGSPASSEPVADAEIESTEYHAALAADLSRQLAAGDGTLWIRVAIGAGVLLFVGLISFLAYAVLMRPDRLDEAAPEKAPPPPSGAVRKVPTPSKTSTGQPPK